MTARPFDAAAFRQAHRERETAKAAAITTAHAGSRRPYRVRVRDAARFGQPFPLPDTANPYQRRLDRNAMRDRIATAVGRVMAWT